MKKRYLEHSGFLSLKTFTKIATPTGKEKGHLNKSIRTNEMRVSKQTSFLARTQTLPDRTQILRVGDARKHKPSAIHFTTSLV